MVEDARRIAQEPGPELLPLPAGHSGHAFRVGAGHDTGAGNVNLSITRELPAGPRPLRKALGLGGKRRRRGGAGYQCQCGAPSGGAGPELRRGLWGREHVGGISPRSHFSLRRHSLVGMHAGEKVGDLPFEPSFNSVFLCKNGKTLESL